MKKKLLAMLLVGGMLCMSLTACGSKDDSSSKPKEKETKVENEKGSDTDEKFETVTLDALLEKATKANEDMLDLESIVISMDVDLDGRATAYGEDMDMKVSGDMKFEGALKEGTHISGNLDVSSMGETDKVTIDSYTKYDGDKAITYDYDYLFDSWTFYEEDLEDVSMYTYSELAGLLQGKDLNIDNLDSFLKLEEEVADYKGKRAFHVTADITGDTIIDLALKGSTLISEEDLGMSAEDLAEELEGMDLSFINIKMNMYYDAKTYGMIGLVIDLSDCDITKMLETFSTSTDGVEVELNKARLEISIDSIDEYKFSIPTDVIDNAKEEDIYGFDFDSEYPENDFDFDSEYPEDDGVNGSQFDIMD